MRGKRLLFGILAMLTLLCSCGRSNETGTPAATPTGGLTPTPLVPFDLAPAVTSTPTSVYLEPSAVSLAVGQSATINVRLDGARQLNRIALEVSFDPACVGVEDADSAAEGTQVTPGTIPQPVHVSQNQVVPGVPARVLYQAALDPGAAVDGSGVVASLTVRGLAAGVCTLSFVSVSAADADGQPLLILPLADGLVAVSAEGSPPATLPAVAPIAQPTAPSAQATRLPSDSGIYYVVQPGDTLFHIALTFGTTGDAIAAANGIGDPGQLAVGSMILIPIAPPRGRLGYYVQPGDTLYAISRRVGLSVDELSARNALGSDYNIAAGQVLVVTP